MIKETTRSTKKRTKIKEFDITLINMSTIPVTIPNTAQRIIDTSCGELQIMVSWPLGWTEDGQPCEDENLSDVPVM